MPWRVSDVYDERVRFVAMALRGDCSHAEACVLHGISRQTGYKWIERYHAGGWDSLRDASRARHTQDRTMPARVAAALLELRGLRPSWGPKKLRAYLAMREPEVTWPACSTIGDLLRREGLAAGRPRRRWEAVARSPLASAQAPNDIWSIDFKGWFRTRDGRRCDPLTVSDAASRYLLGCEIVVPTTQGVKPVCERLFREYGLPLALRSDNGPPFAASGAGGLTRLAVWWLKLGIALDRIDPGCPQQNGRHERMHRTLKAETSCPPAESAAEQQQRFETFRLAFNEERPHEALDMATPASRYAAAPRSYPTRVPEPWYDADHQVRRVRQDGAIKWHGNWIFLSEALIGEPVGIAETETGDWIVRFTHLPLGRIDRQDQTFHRFTPAPRARRKPQSNRDSVNHVTGS